MLESAGFVVTSCKQLCDGGGREKKHWHTQNSLRKFTQTHAKPTRLHKSKQAWNWGEGHFETSLMTRISVSSKFPDFFQNHSKVLCQTTRAWKFSVMESISDFLINCQKAALSSDDTSDCVFKYSLYCLPKWVMWEWECNISKALLMLPNKWVGVGNKDTQL